MKDNIYILRSYGNNNTSIIKLGYTSNMNSRLKTYYSHNPLLEIIGTYYVEEGPLFEKAFHSNNLSHVLYEWYKEERLPIMLSAIKNKNYIEDVDFIKERKTRNLSIKLIYTRYLKAIKDNNQFVINNTNEKIIYYHNTIGEKKIKALLYRPCRIIKYIEQEEKFSFYHLQIKMILNYNIGDWKTKKDIKSDFKKIYEQLNIERSPKATDISYFYNTARRQKTIAGIKHYGITIINNT